MVNSGTFFYFCFTSQLPISGHIKISILMPPETGNLKMSHFNYSPLFLGGNMSSQPQPGAN